MVVGPEPSVKGSGALAAVAVDRTGHPATQHRADEALCLAIGLWAVGACAQVADAQSATGDRVDRGAIGRAVVGEQLLHRHPVALIEGDRPPEERDDGAGLLVGQDLGIGQARAVVDRDMHELPAALSSTTARRVGLVGVPAAFAGHAVPGTALDAPELLDVDVDQLSRALALITDRRLEAQAPELAHPDPQQDS